MAPGLLGIVLAANKGTLKNLWFIAHFFQNRLSQITDIGLCWSLYEEVSFFLSSPEIPVEAHTEMGRKEGDYDWKKSTDNIQDVFEFMDVLGT